MVAARAVVLSVLTLLLCVSVLAVPPFQTSDTSSQLTVVFPKLDAYVVGSEPTVHFHVFGPDGRPIDNATVDCILHVYNSSDMHIFAQELSYDVTEWEATLNSSITGVVGYLPYTAYCYNATIGGFVSGAFDVTTDGVAETTPFQWVILAFLPLLFGFLLVMGARLFDPVEHWVLQVGAYLLALISSFASAWWAGLAVIKFAEWGEMQEAIASWTWMSGLMVAVVAVYWMIYVFVRLVSIAAQKKERRLES